MSDQEIIASLVAQLTDGWYERVEYMKRVQVHTDVCRRLRMKCEPGRLKHYQCRCPVRVEPRTDRIRQVPLLAQLVGEVTGYSPASMGARWGRPGSRPPGNLDMLDLVNAIGEWTYGLGIIKGTLAERLRRIVTTSGEADYEWTQLAIKHLRRYIRTARIMLQYEVPKRALRDTVCGECGGVLVVAVDADSDVACAGTPEAGACGMVYRRWQWIDLLETAEG